MKIAYLGIDLLRCALEAALAEGCEVLRLFSCETDNVTEFNTAVLSAARDRGIPVTLSPITKTDLAQLAAQGCQLLLCAGYYHKVPVTDDFPMVNLHPAPLPRFRGAWPMPCMLLRGEAEGGVVLHKMARDFDAGDILLETSFPLSPADTLKDYMAKTEEAAPGLVSRLIRELPALLELARPQGAGTYWPCPTEADWTVTPEMTAEAADRVLRAFFGYECVYRSGDRRFELIGGRAVAGAESPFPVRGGAILARSARELEAYV